MEFEKPGIYMFELRRWTKESGLPLNSSTDEVRSENNDIELKRWGEKPEGKAYNIVRAKLEVNETEKEITVNLSDESANITMKLENGLADVKTW